MNSPRRLKVAVLLNGCGHRDGSEIQEAVLALLGIEAASGEWLAVAIDENQARTVNHSSGLITPEPRNMLVESARIARGKVISIAAVNVADFDALIIPGGSGTAVNLCDYAEAGAAMTVHPSVVRLIREFHSLRKPIGAICIAPMLLAGSLKDFRISITLGSDDNDAAKAAMVMGARVVSCASNEICEDRGNLLVTTPAYMRDSSLRDIHVGIAALASAVLALARGP